MEHKNNEKGEVNFDFILDSYYESISNSLINKVRKDAGNYEELNYIKKIKKDISQESRKQYKIIISYCQEEKVPDIKSALKNYDFLHFLKLVIRILDIDEEYNLKVEQCKKYFSNSENFEIIKYLHDHTEVTARELKPFIGVQNNNLNLSLSKLSDLINKKDENNSTYYSLSPAARNLYAFYMMKNIDTGDMVSNYNEAKVNEVLEYLIEYILSQQEKKHKNLKRPKLNSTSANYNLDTIINLLDQKTSYSNDYIHFSDKKSEPIDDWKGSKLWKVSY